MHMKGHGAFVKSDTATETGHLGDFWMNLLAINFAILAVYCVIFMLCKESHRK